MKFQVHQPAREPEVVFWNDAHSGLWSHLKVNAVSASSIGGHIALLRSEDIYKDVLKRRRERRNSIECNTRLAFQC